MIHKILHALNRNSVRYDRYSFFLLHWAYLPMMQLAYDTVSLLGGEGGYDADHRAYSRCDQAGGRI